MTSNDESHRFRRILIAMDAESPSGPSARAAARLARRLEAELVGWFLEDASLMRLADNPLARHLDLPSGTASQIDKESLERQLESLATEAREALERECGEQAIEWSFEVRDEPLEKLAEASQMGDLLVVETVGRQLGAKTYMRTSAAAIGATLPVSVLFLQQGASGPESIVIPYDGSLVAGDALEMASELAQIDGTMLSVGLIPSDEHSSVELRARAEERLRPLAADTIEFHRLSEASADALASVVKAVGGDLLVLPASPEVVDTATVREMVERVDCPLLVFR